MGGMGRWTACRTGHDLDGQGQRPLGRTAGRVPGRPKGRRPCGAQAQGAGQFPGRGRGNRFRCGDPAYLGACSTKTPMMEKRDYQDLMAPEVLSSVSGLSLLAKVVVEAFLSGMHRSHKLGSGMEFSQYRAYEPGDDPRLLDWKMLARSGRYYVRQSEQQNQVVVKFILDASASMDHSEKGISKLAFARALVACLSHLAQKQGDAIGLFALNQEDFVEIHPRTHKMQHPRLLLELLKIGPKGQWPQAPTAIRKVPSSGQRELIIFITDMYEQKRELSEFIR